MLSIGGDMRNINIFVVCLWVLVISTPLFAGNQPEGSEIQCPRAQELDDIEMWLDHLELLQRTGVEDSEYDKYSKKIKEIADDYGKKVSKTNHCAATDEDIYCNVKLVEMLLKFGSEQGSSDVMKWSQRAYRAIAADVSILTNKQNRHKVAEQANKLGLADVSSAVLQGKKVKTDCVIDWRVTAKISYKCTMEGVRCQWETTINFPKVIMTGWRSLLGGQLPLLSSFQEWVTAPTVREEYAYFDGDKWIQCDIDKTMTWQCGVTFNPDLGKPAGATGKVRILLATHPMKTQGVSKCDDGTTSPMSGQTGRFGPYYIPVEKIANGKPFSVKFKNSDGDGISKISLSFSPK